MPPTLSTQSVIGSSVWAVHWRHLKQWRPLFFFLPFHLVVHITSKPAMDVKVRKNLAFVTRLDIIQHVENSGKIKSLGAEAFSVPRSMLSTFLQDKTYIKTKVARRAGQSCEGAYSLRTPAFERIEKTLYTWFTDIQAGNVPWIDQCWLKSRVLHIGFTLLWQKLGALRGSSVVPTAAKHGTCQANVLYVFWSSSNSIYVGSTVAKLKWEIHCSHATTKYPMCHV